jgi:hypothetical protein
MRTHWKQAAAITVVLAVVAVLLLTPLPRHWHGLWQSKFFDLGHVPLFGAMTVTLWLVLRSLWWPALIALSVAGLAELVQDWFGRSGDFLDFVRGALGVGAAVVALHAWQGPRNGRRLAGHALLILGLVAWPIADCGPYLLDAYETSLSFPILADFATGRQLLRWKCNQSRVTRVPNGDQAGQWVGRLELQAGPADYPGAMLENVVRNWSGYRRLVCAFALEGEPLVLVVSIRGRDKAGQQIHSQFGRLYGPGQHLVRVELAAIAAQAEPAPLNLSEVLYLQVYTFRRNEPRIVFLHGFWLE